MKIKGIVLAVIAVFMLAYLSSSFVCGTLDIMAMKQDTKILMFAISISLVALALLTSDRNDNC